jgi:hypothetical protein
MSDIIDINIYPTVETISLTIAPNLTTINVNTVTGGGVSSVNGQTGVVVLNQDDILDGTTYKQYSQTEKTKLAGIAAGAEVNVNADWNAVSGDALILNKPTIPSAATFVPYSGSTQDVNLGEFGIQLGNLEFDLTPTNVPTGVGSMVWNDTAGTLDLKLKGGAVTLQIGQETVARVVNKTSTNITLLESNYQIVRVTGAQGQRPKVDLALANNDLNSTTTLGLVTENILNNAEGFITTSGQVQQINTTGSLQGETWADGDVLYLSGTVAGQATNIKPAAPIHTVIIGFVEYAHINQGKIFVKVDNGYELEELHNVSAIAPNNNEVLTYDTPTLLWKPKTVSTALGFTPENVANKENTTLDNSTTKYPTNNLVKINNELQTYAQENNQIYGAQGVGLSTFFNLGQVGAGIVTSGVASASRTSGILGRQNKVWFQSTEVAGTFGYYRTTQVNNAVTTQDTYEVMFGTSDPATVAGARSFVGYTNNFSNPSNVEPTSFVNSVGIARLSTSNNWNVIHNDNVGVCTAIDLGVNFPSNTLDTDLIYFKLIFNLDGTISYVVTNKSTNITTSGLISTNLPIGTLYEQMWTCNNATALIARLSFCVRTIRTSKLI